MLQVQWVQLLLNASKAPSGTGRHRPEGWGLCPWTAVVKVSAAPVLQRIVWRLCPSGHGHAGAPAANRTGRSGVPPPRSSTLRSQHPLCPGGVKISCKTSFNRQAHGLSLVEIRPRFGRSPMLDGTATSRQPNMPNRGPNREFWRLRMCGARFEDGGIPLQVLSDLGALREMVLEVAKGRYLAKNPDRQRAPRGFADKIDLRLTGIDKGSAMAVINFTTTETEALLPGMSPQYLDYLLWARDAIAQSVASASGNGNTSSDQILPKPLLAYFNRVGRSLHEGESIEFPMPNGSAPAQLTPETRRLLIQRSEMTEFTLETTLRGRVPEADQGKMTFELEQIYGKKIVASIPEQYREVIINAFKGYQKNHRILVEGIGRYDHRDRLYGVETIEQVTPLDPLDVPARLDELRKMQDGWLDGGGKAPSHQGLGWLSASFQQNFPDELPLPHLYPTPEGGIEAEWSLGKHSIILEFHLDTHRGDWLQFSKESEDEECSRSLDLNKTEAWHWLAKAIGNCIQGDSA